jgi:hypothetical protein
MKWFGRNKKPTVNKATKPVASAAAPMASMGVLTGTAVMPNAATSGPLVFTTGGQNATSQFSANVYPSMGVTQAPPHIFQLYQQNKEIVRLTDDGKVVWANGFEVDEAAEALGKTMVLSSEIRSGITKRVKADMRDSIFNDLISIAEKKGSLSAEDLTFLLEASKIMEKLKGGY